MKTAAVFLASAILLATPLAAQEAVYVVRHAEQVKGVENPPLTEEGRERAAALVTFLRDAGITGVYSSEANRTRETAEPLSKALGLQLRQFPREDTAGLIESVRQEHPHGRVLIVGHSETVPAILKGLGHEGEVTIDKHDYDNVFVVVPRVGRAPVILRQRLN